VGSKDNVSIEYAPFNGKFNDYVTANTGTIYLYNTPAVINPATGVNVNVSNFGKSTKLYIDEDVALKPAAGSKAAVAIEAYVGVTIDNSAGAGGANPSFGGSDAIDWHFFSSALTDAAIGLSYPDETTPVPYGTSPTQATFTTSSQYFPANLNDHYNDWDLYAYTEPDYHWINLKRNSLSHWHEDADSEGDHYWIDYTNDTRFEPGRGYMVALKEEGYLQAYGTLNTHTSADLEVDLDYTSSISWTGRQGLNLLGNPYQSYLDFDAFASANSGGETGKVWSDIKNASYIILDEDTPNRGYVQYVINQSSNTFGANRYLHPHQGFMVKAGKTGLTAVFNDDMRDVTGTASFRGRINYPLVNLFATDDNGNRDMVTVELGRPDKGGALKVHSLHAGKGSVYCHYEDEDYGIVFTQPGLDAASIRFATDEDAEYTMTWNTQNGEFGYLHLIDNITGADIDCLTTDEYRFTSKTTDYKSRFRLVFDYTGIGENGEDGPSTGSGTVETFAYYANGEIHLTQMYDNASLQVIDLLGRVVMQGDAINRVSTSGMAPGVYVLRLIGDNGTRTQKIIIDK
jgi:hypothetical protein